MKKLVFDDFQSHDDERPGVPSAPRDDRGRQDDPPRIETARRSEEPSPKPSRSQTMADAPAMKFRAFKPTARQDAHNAVREFQISDFFDADSEIYKGDTEPRAEFDFLLLKVLTAVKETLFAHSVAFFWANREKQQMVLETRVTDSQHFIPTRRFPFGHDLVSKVALTGKPELVTEINPSSERELFPYYEQSVSVKSFVGVPVYFSKPGSDVHNDQPVGVVIVDGIAEDEFGGETLELLGKFTKLISALIKSYTDKYDLLLDSELLRSIRRLQERIKKDFSPGAIVQILAEETSKLINWDYLTVVLYDETRHAWVARKVTNRSHLPYIIPDQAIDFPESLVARTIKNNLHTSIDNLETCETVRYFADEKLDKRGSFVSVPISSLNKCYGAVNIESRERYNFTRQDTEMLYRLAENVASALEILYLNEVITEYVIVDEATGMYSKKFFLQKVEDELHRADDTGSELSLLFVTIDKSQEVENRFGREGFERVIVTLAKAIRASVRTYDVVGRYEYNRFGIVLVNTASNEAYLWAEKIRKNVAGHVISLDGKSFSVTISIGVCGALDGMRKEELLGNAAAVIHRASEAGGNTVRVF
jgi:diguanylate cyclase (GGDEF)-like protein